MSFEKLFFKLRYLLVFILVISFTMPVIVVSQETATTTLEIISNQESGVATSIATTTEEVILVSPESLQPEGEVLGITTENIEVDSEGERYNEETEEGLGEIVAENPPPKPALSVRKLERKIIVNKKAAHTCEAETFRTDISGMASAQVRVMLYRDTDMTYEVEIGGLPDGIDVTFLKNSAYQYTQGVEDRYLTLLINNQTGSQKGDFSVPVVYTQKGSSDSSVICQLNIVNQ